MAEPVVISCLTELLDQFKITSWDLAILGDGSGGGWGMPVGWGALLVDRTGWRDWIIGGAGAGTITNAEVEWVTQALRVDYHKHCDSRLKQSRRVVLFSDSAVTVQTGQGTNTAGRHNAPELWNTVEYYRSLGYVLSWFHLPRNSNPAMSAADELSKHAFSLAKGWEFLKEDPYAVFPFNKS